MAVELTTKLPSCMGRDARSVCVCVCVCVCEKERYNERGGGVDRV